MCRDGNGPLLQGVICPSASDQAKGSLTLPEMPGGCVTHGRQLCLEKLPVSERGIIFTEGEKELCKISRVEALARSSTHMMLGNLYLCAKIQPPSIALQTWVDVLAELPAITRAARNRAFLSGEALSRMEKLRVQTGSRALT